MLARGTGAGRSSVASVTAAALLGAACEVACGCMAITQVRRAYLSIAQAGHEVPQALAAAQLALGAGRAALMGAAQRQAAAGGAARQYQAAAIAAQVRLVRDSAQAVAYFGNNLHRPDRVLPARPLLAWMAEAADAVARVEERHGEQAFRCSVLELRAGLRALSLLPRPICGAPAVEPRTSASC